MKSDEYWMAKALLLARQAMLKGEVPVGAVLVANDELLGEGANCPISSCDPTAHAEIIALRDAAKKQANYRLPDTSLYVTIEPCTMCAGAIIHSRVARVIYGATEPKSGVIESNPNLFESAHFNHQVQCLGGVLAEESSQLLKDFFKTRRAAKKQIASQRI